LFLSITMRPSRQHLLQLAIACLALFILFIAWMVITHGGTSVGFDFRSYLAGAHIVAAGGNPYHRLALAIQQSGVTGSSFNSSVYVYPPLFALLLAVPLHLGMSDYGVWLLWSIVNLVTLLWAASEMSLVLRQRRDLVLTCVFATALVLVDAMKYDIDLGQTDLFITALVVIAIGLWLRRNPWAALALGVAIAIKPTMALILLVWLWKGDWWTAARGTVASIALVVLPFAIVGLTALHDYMNFLVHWKAFGADAEIVNQSIYGMLLRLFTLSSYVKPHIAPLINAPVLIWPLRVMLIAAALYWWLHHVPRARAQSPALGFAECLLALPLIVLVSPLAEDIHVCIIAPTMVGFRYLAASQRLWRLPAAWVQWVTLVIGSIPRFRDLIYPDQLVLFPLQTDPHVGNLVALFRSGLLLWMTVATFIASASILRATRTQMVPVEAEAHIEPSPVPVLAVVIESL
jgi:hypothetical protein